MLYCSQIISLSNDVAKEKNKALKKMLASDRDYFFLIEENCKVLDEKVYDKFIEASQKTGVEALMWARGAINNRLSFDDDPYINYYSDFASNFSMFTRNVVETVGYFDEKMPKNTWQELEYAKRIGDAGLSTPFGTFAGPKGVDSMLEVTQPKEEFKNLTEMDEALDYWQNKDIEGFPINMKKLGKAPKIEMI